jgi:glutamate-1-semialdehyde 2,1-aminomutase
MTQNERYSKSQTLLKRTEANIPTASQTFSKSPLQFPRGHSPHFLDRGKDGKVWDIDGNEYVDLMAGLLPVLLGYCDPDVDDAIKAQLDKGISYSLASPLENELAELLIDLIPCAEMVKYGKNGTDATSSAVRLARAFTGRDRVIACGYHGWQDWYIGATSRNKGVPDQVSQLTIKCPFNDLEAVHSAFATYPNDIACIILEPMSGQAPKVGYLEELKEIVHANGALLIFDEIVTGFRFANGGAQEKFGVTPDLAAFGKAMGNGMPISAILGRGDIMAEMEQVFMSSTFGGEALSLAASIAVIKKMLREPVVEKLYETGTKLSDGALNFISKHGLDEVISIDGNETWKLLAFQDHPHATKWAIRSFFQVSMMELGVLMTGSHNVIYSHTDDDIAKVLAAYNQTLSELKETLKKPDLDNRLGYDVVQPVFAVRN